LNSPPIDPLIDAHKLTARLRTVRRTIGSTQPGFLTMSSNVFFGEKEKRRLIAAERTNRC